MKRYVFPVTVVALTLCQYANADGYIPYGRLMSSRMPNTLFTSSGTTQPYTAETLKTPATVNGNATGYEGYPFVDRCNSGCNSCCEGAWDGYSRNCFRGHKGGHGHHGFAKHGYGGCGCNTGGCDSGYGGNSSGCGCDPCGCGGYGRSGCGGNSFSGGCGGCMGGGWGGLHQMKMGLHGLKHGRGCGCGGDSGYANFGGCSSCGGNGNSGYSGDMHGAPMNAAPVQQIPTPAAESVPPVAPATKSAFLPAMPRGFMTRVTNW